MKIFSKTGTSRNLPTERGFTLLEMIVSTTVFVFVMLMIIGSLISLTDASRKARSVRIVLDNLSAAIDSMSRNIRMGSYYHCGCGGALTSPQSCSMSDSDGNGGDTCLAFEMANGNPHDATDQMVYRLTTTGGRGRIERSLNGGTDWVSLTSPEINVTDMKFFQYGVTPDTDQPVVTMLLRGTAALTPKTSTEFNIQTTIAARTPNFTAP